MNYSKRPGYLKRIMYVFIIIALLLSNFTPVNNARVNAAVYGGVTVSGDTVTIPSGSDQLIVQVCSPQILKVNYKPNGSEDAETLVIDPNKKWNTGNIVSSDTTSDPIVIKTTKMIIKISKADLGVSVYNSSNGLLLKQTSLANNAVTFSHNSGDAYYGIYGLGTGGSDSTLRTGSHLVQAGGQGTCGAPFTWSTGGYGLLVDSDGGNIDVENTSLSYTGISKKNTEYFVMVGTPTEVLQSEAQVSGTSPMFPKWATGFTNTQWGWKGTGTDEDQLKAVINQYRANGYPIDNFCLDFDWKSWGFGDYGEFKWNSTNFPNGASGQLAKTLANQGVKLSGIMKPRLFTGTAESAIADANNWWQPNSTASDDYCAKDLPGVEHKQIRNLNFDDAGLRAWWWGQTKSCFKSGIVGYWNDECDNDSSNGYKNFGNLNMQRSQYEGQTADTNQRVWSLNRTYYAGAQRYAYGLWSGDIGSGFQTMKNQKDHLLAAVNLGEAKWGMDTGGFTDDPSNENYARWMEFSAFVPIFRVHGKNTCKTRYPWNYGDTAAVAVKDVMQLRYKLIPYIYKYDQQASDTGVGLVKSLMMAYPNDPKTKTDTDAWMFGDSLLVSPVLDQGQTSKSIYLPAGTWTDYFTGKTYAGGQTIDYAVDSTTWKDVPLFIKQGAIIPSQDYEDYVGQKKMTNIYVDVFPDSKATSFDYYDDDGNTTSYKNGSYFKQRLSVAPTSSRDGISFTTGLKEGTYTPDVQNYIVKLHVKSTGAITVGGQPITQYSSLEQLKNASGEGYATGTDTYGNVIYVKVAAGQFKTVNAQCDLPQPTPQTATVYAKSSSSSANLQYSVDGGATWSASQAMTQSDKIGYLQSTFTYRLTTADAVKVRYQDSTGYKPSSDGVTLPNDGNSIFTIAKDGTVSTGVPVLSTAKVYIQASTAKSPILQYKNDSGNWSSSISMDAWFGDTTKTEYTKTLSYSADDGTPAIRYSEDGGTTWKPSAAGQAIGDGDYMNDTTGAIVAGKPAWKQIITIHYKNPTSWGAPNIYAYSSDASKTPYTGKWPGIKMTSEGNGWYSYTIEEATAKVLFNDGKNQDPGSQQPGFDVAAGESWYDGSSWSTINPNAPVLSVDVKGGNYEAAQTVTITATPSASIYYTLDGTVPTASSTKYTSPVNINVSENLRAIAIDTQANKSNEINELYTIGKVIVPTTVLANIRGGSYTSAQTVILTATPADASIYYTTDGSTPTALSTKYTAPIIVSNSEILKFIAIDTLGNQSAIGTEQYTINIPPVYSITVTANVNDVPNSAAKSITLTPSTTAAIYYTEDGTIPTILSTKYIGTFRVNSGTRLNYFAVDLLGNKSKVYTLNINVQQIILHFKNPSNWTAPNLYYYDAAGQLTGPAYPGVSMTSEGNGWYTYTIEGWTYATISFNAGTNQSPASGQSGYDVSGEKWIENGSIYSSNPDNGSTTALSLSTDLPNLLAA